jgi:MFS family permease
MDLRERLRQRSFSGQGRRVVAVVSGSHFLNHMFLVLLPPIFGVLATEFDVSLAELGLAITVMSLASAAFQIPFGYLSDNYSRTLTLAVGLGVASAGVAVVAVSWSFPALLAGQALVGVGIGAHHPAHYPLLSDATAEGNRGWGFSVHDTAGYLGYGAAPALVVSLVAFPGRTWRDGFLLVAAVSALYALASFVVLSRGVDDAVTRGGRTADGADASEGREVDDGDDGWSPLAATREQLRSLVRSPAVLALTLLALIAAMAGWGFRSFTVVLLTDGYGYGLTAANTALTVMFVGSAVATLASGLLTDRFSAASIIVPAFLGVGAFAVVAGSQAVVPLVAAGAVVAGASAHSMSNTPRNKLLDNLSSREDIGVNFAVITIGVTLGGSIAPPLFGALIEGYGFWAAFYLIGAFALVGVAVVLAIVRIYDVSPPDEGTAAAAGD